MDASEVSTETERFFSEDEELEQLLNGEICFKVYPFSSGMSPLVGYKYIFLDACKYYSFRLLVILQKMIVQGDRHQMQKER